MTPEELAALHERCFDHTPPPWSAHDFALLLALPGARLISRHGGFALARVAGPEAELLTLAVDPDLRRKGHGRALLDRLASDLAAEGVTEIFLEVAETNGAGRALYAAAGYVARGRRRDYYRHIGAPAVDALILARDLRAHGG